MQVNAGGVTLEVDDRGPRDAPAVLLIMGLGMQLTGWPEPLVDDLLARGHRVIRFDNRDAGLSQGFDTQGLPNLVVASLRWWLRLPVKAPYTLGEMAADTVALMDALGVQQAHVCGASMGGMIAQHIAARHPDRVRRLTLMMTTSGARRLPQARPHVRAALLSRPRGRDPDAVVAHLTHLFHLIGSPGYRPTPEALQARLRGAVDRAWRPAGTARQLTAVAADGDRTPLLRQITVPTTVIHGRDDALIPVECGEDLARHIRGAHLELIPGMGHDLPDALLPRFAQLIAG
ncbi:MAG: alpha/beta fold hydrolase [Rhodoferax sp.]|nr:alpha/beta fold hydrolase [Rhodoferax sp.]